MRLFIAIPLAPAVTRQLASLRSQLERPGDGLRWSSPESWHVTLQFLGAADESQYRCLMNCLSDLLAPVPRNPFAQTNGPGPGGGCAAILDIHGDRIRSIRKLPGSVGFAL
jgi:hypothetical protein